VLEFLCGACAGLDEYTTFHPPGAYPKPMAKPTVIGEEMASEQHGVGYLRISEFQENTSREFDAAVARLRMRGMRALVVDLRGNPGGLLLAGVELGRRLLPAGVIVTSESGPTAFELPLVLLVDAGTMSTAEVVASAIKDNARGSLVGTPTYGKGTVQATQKLKDGEKAGAGGVLIMTIAKSIAPNGRPMASVVPDILERDPELQMKAAVSQATAMASMGRPMSMMP
jgi:carboxyl-terminal processing protease